MILENFHFIRPYWLLALLVLVLLVFFSLKHKLQQSTWQAECDVELLPFILEENPVKSSHIPLIIGSIAALLAVIALAGPTWKRLPMPVFRNASALVIVLDLSRSMDAADIKPSRLIRARYKIADLLAARKDGQTALIVYAGSAFTVTPLTEDTETINSLLNISTDIMPSQGSDTAGALAQAVNLFKNAGLQQGQILLVTDDDAISGDVPAGYSVSILGVGTEAGAPIRLSDGGFLKDRQGNIVLPQLKVSALQQFAQQAGGLFLTLGDNNSDIEALNAYFEQQSKRKSGIESELLLESWQEFGVWLLLPLLLLASLSFRRGLLSVVWLILLPFPQESQAMTWQDLWQTPDQQAQEKYNQGAYPQAAEQFTDAAWQAAARYKSEQTTEAEMLPANTETGFYNQGNVQAKAGKLQEALDSYAEALKLNTNHADAEYNQTVVKKALEQQEQQKKQQDSDEKQEGDKQDKQSKEENQQGGEPKEGESQDGEPQENNNQQEQDKKDDSEQNKPPSSEEPQGSEEQSEKEAEQAKQGESSEPKENENTESETTAQAEEAELSDEQKQASEQWLKRIVDDPSGLLRRKFLYQYSRQKQAPKSDKSW